MINYYEKKKFNIFEQNNKQSFFTFFAQHFKYSLSLHFQYLLGVDTARTEDYFISVPALALFLRIVTILQGFRFGCDFDYLMVEDWHEFLIFFKILEIRYKNTNKLTL